MLPLAALLLTLLAAPAPARQADPVPTRIDHYARGLEARVFLPAGKGKHPAILLFHGGGWVAGSADWTDAAAQRFAARGIVAISIEYRLSGPEVTPADAFDDACDAFIWARANAGRLGIDDARIGGYGVSAGGQLVALMATGGCLGVDDHVFIPALVVMRSPALDLERDPYFLRLMRTRRAHVYSPVSQGPTTVPTLIIQGDADTLTPPGGAAAFCNGAMKAKVYCRVSLYPGLGHLLTRNLANQEDDYDPDPAAVARSWDEIFAFLKMQGWVK